MLGLREMKMAFVVFEERQYEENTSLIKQMVSPIHKHNWNAKCALQLFGLEEIFRLKIYCLKFCSILLH